MHVSFRYLWVGEAADEMQQCFYFVPCGLLSLKLSKIKDSHHGGAKTVVPTGKRVDSECVYVLRPRYHNLVSTNSHLAKHVIFKLHTDYIRTSFKTY